jgi:deoxyribodipyrimidine photo-lyase
MQKPSVLIYIMRHDLRIADNPILHHLASASGNGFTHLLPLYTIPPHQVEVSGFLKNGEESPYPEAKSEVGRFWRCGPHRARFVAQSVWNLKDKFSKLGNDLTIRIGRPAEVLKDLVEGLRRHHREVTAVWMVAEEGYEEERDEKAVAETCSMFGVNFQTWVDEKYFIDE